MQKDKFNMAIVVVGCLLLAVCSVGVSKVLYSGSLDSIYYLGAIVLLGSLIFSIIYLALGYSKGFSDLYKTAVSLGALNALFATVSATNEANNYIAIMMCAISFGLYVLLAFAKDLGKTKSYIFCAIIIACRLAGLIANTISYGSIVDEHSILIAGQFALALTIFIATIAKYIDKAERGTK